jgi:hypothetical protein
MMILTRYSANHIRLGICLDVTTFRVKGLNQTSTHRHRHVLKCGPSVQVAHVCEIESPIGTWTQTDIGPSLTSSDTQSSFRHARRRDNEVSRNLGAALSMLVRCRSS